MIHILQENITFQENITGQKFSFYHTHFLYSIILPLNFHLCTNLSIYYTRNPRTPANHSAAAEHFKQN